MFGTNPQRSIVISDGRQLAIQSLFYTIQGEGPFSGMPAVFIRLAGCNLACSFCDTDFESAFKLPAGGVETVERLLSQLNFELALNPSTRLVVITGGEPMRQNISALAAAIFSAWPDVHIQVETAGTVAPQEPVSALCLPNFTFVVSPKTPKVAPFYLSPFTHWKYIVKATDSHPDDGLPFLPTQHSRLYGTGPAVHDHAFYYASPAIFRAPKGSNIWVSPCDEYDADKNAANVRAAVRVSLKFGYRLSLQVHKIVGLE
jgi:organic radical activating enzyme